MVSAGRVMSDPASPGCAAQSPRRDRARVGAAIEAMYLPYGAVNVIHFIGATAMAAPDCRVPLQFPSPRRLAKGDVVFTEISRRSGIIPAGAASFTVDAEPTPLYRDLHKTAEAAFDAIAAVLREGATPADVVAASAVIEEAGFTTDDDVSRLWRRLSAADHRLEKPVRRQAAGAYLQGRDVVVIQPNVVTHDGKAGVDRRMRADHQDRHRAATQRAARLRAEFT